GNHKGQDLLRAVLNSIGVPEQQFFGLRYQDSRKTLQWVNVRKSVHSLVKCCRGGLSDLVGEKSCQLFLAIRFYPNDPCRELSETTRLQVFLQTIQDIQSGAVVVPRDKAPRLAALMLQSYHGDFDHQMGFPLNNYSLFADLRPGIDSEVASMYRMFKGLPASRAEYQFLSHVKWLEGYGRVNFRVLLDDGSLSTLCIETTGIVLRSQSASGSQACFFWPRIKKFQLKKHRMVMKVRSKAEEGGIHEFRTDDKHQLQELWETCCEHLEFFRSGIDPSFRQASGNAASSEAAETAAYRRPRRREFEHSDQWLHDPRQQEASQHQLHLQQQQRRMRNRPAIDTRSMRDIRAPVASTSSVYGDDPYRPFMSDSEAVTKTNNEAGSRRRHPIAPAASASSAAASGGGRSRRPILAEASSGLLSHIRHDRVDSSGLSQEQLRQIEFTQLPADRGLRVNYDAQTGRGRLRLTAPRAEIIPRSSGPVPQDSTGPVADADAAAVAAAAAAAAAAAGRSPMSHRQQLQPRQVDHGAAAPGWSLYGDYLSEGPPSGGNYRHSHNNSYQAAVSDTETDPNRRYQPLRGPQPHVPQHQPQQPLYQNQHRLQQQHWQPPVPPPRQPHSRFSTHQTLV
ncbi:hypothetical protein BOX15_Mlig000943g3, partial [Macrostomum lignano]